MTKHAFVFQGGGQYFYWMLGVRDYMDTRLDTRNTLMVGASSGALCAVFAACGLSSSHIIRTCERIYNRHDPTNRLLGVCGIWSEMVKELLEELLPVDAHERCNGKTHIIVSRFLRPKIVVSSFESRLDLIECLLATTHLPLYMNYRPFRTFRGQWCYDGDWACRCNEDYEILDGAQVGAQVVYHHFDYSKDDNCTHNSMRAHNTGVFSDMVRCGYEHAKRVYET